MLALMFVPGMILALIGLLSGAWIESETLVGILHIDKWSISMLVFTSALSTMLYGIAQRQLRKVKGIGWKLAWFFTLFSVQMTFVSNHIVLLVFALFGSSLGLYQLLKVFQHRPLAQRVALNYLKVALLGDLIIFFGLTWMYSSTQSFFLSEILQDQAQPEWILVVIGLGGMVKSVQYPFNRWLTQALENPSTVSAFMHAGLVNVGGFLLLRFSPLVHEHHIILPIATFVGVLTILSAILPMMFQNDVKRRLAWSTSAQMGFLFVEFGLGLWSFVLLHLMGHGIYKAHGFLFSGTKETHRMGGLGVQPLKPLALLLLVTLPILHAQEILPLSFGAVWIVMQACLWVGAWHLGKGSSGIMKWSILVTFLSISVPLAWEFLFQANRLSAPYWIELTALIALSVLGMFSLSPQWFMKQPLLIKWSLKSIAKA